jgi:hypothetical protein
MSAGLYRKQVSRARKRHIDQPRAENAGFEIFVTMDKRLEYEQNLAGRSIAILILRAKSNRLADLLPLVPDLLRTMRIVRRGEIHRISGGKPTS